MGVLHIHFHETIDPLKLQHHTAVPRALWQWDVPVIHIAVRKPLPMQDPHIKRNLYLADVPLLQVFHFPFPIQADDRILDTTAPGRCRYQTRYCRFLHFMSLLGYPSTHSGSPSFLPGTPQGFLSGFHVLSGFLVLSGFHVLSVSCITSCMRTPSRTPGTSSTRGFL